MSKDPIKIHTVRFKLRDSDPIQKWLKSQKSAPRSLSNLITILLKKYHNNNDGYRDWFSVLTSLAMSSAMSISSKPMPTVNNTAESPSSVTTSAKPKSQEPSEATKNSTEKSTNYSANSNSSSDSEALSKKDSSISHKKFRQNGKKNHVMITLDNNSNSDK